MNPARVLPFRKKCGSQSVSFAHAANGAMAPERALPGTERTVKLPKNRFRGGDMRRLAGTGKLPAAFAPAGRVTAGAASHGSSRTEPDRNPRFSGRT
jgi:hypothetical protein